jgi:hypothetical protein
LLPELGHGQVSSGQGIYASGQGIYASGQGMYSSGGLMRSGGLARQHTTSTTSRSIYAIVGGRTTAVSDETTAPYMDATSMDGRSSASQNQSTSASSLVIDEETEAPPFT